MSFPSSFGSQIAAIMDVLAKAAVAEITKLVDDGTVVLRLEMCRKDGEIQELKRSLQLMEVELCQTRDAAAAAAAAAADAAAAAEATRQERADAGVQVSCEEDQEDQETSAMYLESKPVDSLCEAVRRPEESRDLESLVKSEPNDNLAAPETTTDRTGTTDNNVYFEPEERDNPLWLQMFSSHTAEQYPAHASTECSSKRSSTAAEKMDDDSFGAPIKVELEMRPVCMGSPAPNERFRHVSHPEDRHPLHATLQQQQQQVGPSLAAPQAQRSTADTSGSNAGRAEDHALDRNGLKAKRPVNVWRANQRLFTGLVGNKGFPRLYQLEEHRSTYGAFKPFRCLECGKSFTQKTRLKTHQSVHTGERPFSCKICGKMFSRQDNCLRHERFHSGLKPYSCGQCGKSFTVLGNLKIHQEIHLRGR